MWLRIVMHRAEIRSREADRRHADLVRRRYVPVEQKLGLWGVNVRRCVFQPGLRIDVVEVGGGN
jgi:hypothetical protein